MPINLWYVPVSKDNLDYILQKC